jgi:hypothetical protein
MIRLFVLCNNAVEGSHWHCASTAKTLAQAIQKLDPIWKERARMMVYDRGVATPTKHLINLGTKP